MRKHRCRIHDYHYYGDSWIDNQTGTEYQRGYYDENGNRYDALIIEKDGHLESQFDCRFCGTSTKEVWTEGSIPHCPNCGALLIESTDNVIRDTIDDSFIDQEYQVEEEIPVSPRDKKMGCVIVTLLILIMSGSFIGPFIGLLVTFIAGHSSVGNRQGDSYYYESSGDFVINDNLELFGRTFYIEDIGREVSFNDENGCYYDAPSDCYLLYNTEMEPAVWQYWYEGISSDYGEYGWMEYEIDENQWYIETSEDNWVELPSRYDSTDLWYITGNLAGTSYSLDYNIEMLGASIRVDDGTAYYSWDDEIGGYKITGQGSYIYVNFDANPAVIQYWFSGLSDDYSVDGYGGWFEYDYEEDTWYLQTSDGDWAEFEPYDEELWHVDESITGFTGTVVEAY